MTAGRYSRLARKTAIAAEFPGFCRPHMHQDSPSALQAITFDLTRRCWTGVQQQQGQQRDEAVDAGRSPTLKKTAAVMAKTPVATEAVHAKAGPAKPAT